MFFLNLGAGEFFALLGVAAGLITALYFLDRSRPKLIVSTLRFWPQNGSPATRRSRYHVQDPWSLLLQLVSLTLLLLAIAQLEWGKRERPLRNHVLLLDTSSASAQNAANGTVLDDEKRLAREYLLRLGARDRVMLVYAGGLVAPRTPFTADRAELERRVLEAASSYSALNIDRALAFAKRAELWPEGEPGEIVYVGPQRINHSASQPVPHLRILPVNARHENRGITSLVVRRDPEPNAWQATLNVHNYGTTPVRVVLHAGFGATEFAARTLAIAAQADAHADYAFTTSAAGELHMNLAPADGYAADDRASLILPRNGPIQVAAFTSRAGMLQLLLNANPRLSVRYFSPADYRPDVDAEVILLDQFAPASRPPHPTLWIDPPSHNSPLSVQSTVNDQVIESWTSDPELGRGLHSRDVRPHEAHVYQTFSGSIEVASAAKGPVAVAQTKDVGGNRLAITGFDVLAPELRYELSSPLLIANLLSWLAPASFESSEIRCEQAGVVSLTLDPGEDAASLRVVDDHARDLPFSLRHNKLEFYVDRPALMRVISREKERVVSISLPEVAATDWHATTAAIGLPGHLANALSAVDLWRYLAIAAAILLAIEWTLFSRRPGFLRIALKIAAAAMLVAALFSPVVQLPQTKVATVALVDTSASIGGRDLARATQVIQQVAAHRGSNLLTVVPFAAEPQQSQTPEGAQLLKISHSSGMGTDLEAALTEATASIPAGYQPRVLLLSDGNENQGSVARAMAQLQRLHIPVDVVPLAGRSLTNVTISSVALPAAAYEGEQIPVTLTIESPAATTGSLDFSADGKSLGSQSIDLAANSNVIRAHVRMKTSGPVVVSGAIKTGVGGEARFDQVVHIKRARLLYLSQDAPGMDANLLATFSSAEFDVTRDASLLDKGLPGVQLVILNNIDLNTFSIPQKNAIEQYVAAGGGLLLLGGEHQVYKEQKQMDALDRVLPADLAPPRNPEGICVALIIDKSSSMEGRKIELARLSAIGVLDHLRDKDTIGVLIFDNSYQWAVPMRKATDKPFIKRLISGITPDGGTQIAPALSEAYRKVQRTNSAYKHIVLLTDGISEEGDSIELAREAQLHQVTISTVGLGQDVNRAYLEKVASTSGGKSYFLNNPQGLEQILLKDVQDYTGSTAVERELLATVKRKAEIFEGVDLEHAPALRGYARYEAKSGADTLLTINPEKQDPLYVSWQYGLGRSAVWASDAKSRWSNAWVSWPGYDKFWTNVTRGLLSHRSDTAGTAEFDSANGDLIFTYRLSDGVPEPNQIPAVYVLGPQNFAQEIPIRRVAAGVYHGRLRVGWRSGFFRVRTLTDSALFPEIGIYRMEEELKDQGVNQQVLREIASVTGGRYDPAPETAFEPSGRVTYRRTELWPAFLAAVIVLTMLELAIRKGRMFFKAKRERASGSTAAPIAA
ncbi:MAG TPA: VWA domain-containing protein [Bryobacteraceae bacterium]|jgi:Mg-chelatase subunit ChlD|nr:VWA domain-containing protein [Bryobacteraceae bacterium]